MKLRLALFILIFSFYYTLFAQNGSANGYILPAKTQTQPNKNTPYNVLLVFVQIEFDGSPKRPQGFSVQNVRQSWPENKIPSHITNWFNPDSNNLVVDFFKEASFNTFLINADYLTQIITIKESAISDLYLGYPSISNPAYQYFLKQEIYKQLNQVTFNTAKNITPKKLDAWSDNHTPGAPKKAVPNQNIDYVAFFFRNHPCNNDVGFASENSGNNTIKISFNDTVYGADNLQMQCGISHQTFIHEFAHLLLGHNNFHSGGGQHNGGGSNYLGPRQSGWSMMGFGSLQTTNAWERNRLNWVNPEIKITIENTHNNQIWCRNFDNTAYQKGDFNMHQDTLVYEIWLRDFVTFGDAARIKLPFINANNEFEQWLWLENHQTNKRNNSKFDRFIFDGETFDCRPFATPGIYAYHQIDKNNKSGNNTFGGHGDYLRVLPANGFYDYTIPGTTYLNCVAYNGDGTAQYFKKTTQNSLSGASDLAYLIYDKNNDNRIGIGEEILPFLEQRQLTIAQDLPFHGLPTHAFTLSGNKIINMGTNPSANNILTEVSLDEAQPYGQADIKNNRHVYLNGVSIEILEEKPNIINPKLMDIKVKIGFKNPLVNNHVFWSADNIVLPDFGKNISHELVVTEDKSITLYRGTTPTKVGRKNQDSTTVYRNQKYFSQATKFWVEPHAKIYLNKNATIKVTDDSKMVFKPQSEITLANKALIEVQKNGSLVFLENTTINFKPESYIVLKDSATLEIKQAESLVLTGKPIIVAGSNTKIIINNPLLLQDENKNQVKIIDLKAFKKLHKKRWFRSKNYSY